MPRLTLWIPDNYMDLIEQARVRASLADQSLSGYITALVRDSLGKCPHVSYTVICHVCEKETPCDELQN